MKTFTVTSLTANKIEVKAAGHKTLSVDFLFLEINMPRIRDLSLDNIDLIAGQFIDSVRPIMTITNTERTKLVLAIVEYIFNL